MQEIVEYRQPYGWSIINNNRPDAYCGIHCWDYPPLGQGNLSGYREYLESFLNIPEGQDYAMIPNHWYNVSFQVSTTNSNLFNGYVDSIGVYFSQDPVYNFGSEWVGALFTGSNELNVLRPQISSSSILNSKSPNQIPALVNICGTDGWTEISGVVEGGDWNYITIGNFQRKMTWYYKDGLPEDQHLNDNEKKYTYYFIDSVSVVDVTPTNGCICGYKFDVKTQDNQTDTSTCCYTWSVEVPSDNHVCPLLGFTIKYNWSPNNQVYVYTCNQIVANGSTLTGTFCVTRQNSSLNLIPQVEIDYTTGNNENCHDNQMVTCECTCEILQDIYRKALLTKFQILPSGTSEQGKCCYDIWFNNNDDCHFRTDELRSLLIIPTNNPNPTYENNIEDDWANIEILPGNWTVQSDIYYYHIEKWFERPEGAYIFPGDKFLIGTICIPQDDFVYEFKERIMSNPPVHGWMVSCADDATFKLECSANPEDCCSYIALSADVFSSTEPYLFTILWSQISSPGHYCDIYDIKFFNTGDRTNPIWEYPNPSSIFPISSGPSWSYLQTMGGNVQNGTALDMDVCFYGLNGILLCCEHVVGMPPPIFHQSGQQYNFALPDSEFRNLNLYPSPGENEFILNFSLKEKKLVKIYIVNSLGNEINKIFDGYISKDNLNEFKFDLSGYPLGNYFVRINAGNKINNIPLILFK